MDIYAVEKKEEPTYFRINANDTLCDPKHQLDQLNIRLYYGDARRVADVVY
jgi:hypothetical protein